MENITNNLCLIESEQQENACVEGIISFLMYEATSKEPSLAIATILSNLEDACVTAPIEKKTSKSDKLLAFKQYVHSIYDMYITGKSIPIKIYKNTWDDYKRVLSEITEIIKPESEVLFIKQRLNMFIEKIDVAINQILIEEQSAEDEYRKKRFTYGIIGGIIGLVIALSIELSSESVDTSVTIGMSIFFTFIGACSAIIISMYSKKK